MTDPTAPRNLPRLTRYTPHVNGTEFMGMLRQNDTHPEMFGPSYDWTQGPYVLAAEADAEIDRLRAENADLTSAVESLQNRWAARPISHADGEALAKENDRLRAEVERLQTNLNKHIDAKARLTLERDEARASTEQQGNERMSAAVEAVAAAPKRAYYETHDPPHCPTCECGR
jgi:cell division protein FtsB